MLHRAGYPSFALSDTIFGSGEVSAWRKRWEAVWSGDTGMDIMGQLKRIDLFEPPPGMALARQGLLASY